MSDDRSGCRGIEDYAAAQIQMVCDDEAAHGSRIRVMPDVHPGKIGPVGLTMTVGDRILPGLVGSDIGCGVTAAVIKDFRPEFQKLDRVIRQKAPAGFDIRTTPHPAALAFDVSRLRCGRHVHEEKALNSLGTLGGGNHFIEVGRGENDVFSSIHNCLEMTKLGGKDCLMLRKGAVSAEKGQRVIIPANMKDGIILGIGKGCEEWNCSAPHGTGRIMNRGEVKSHFTVSAFRKEMDGIYSSCVGTETTYSGIFAARDYPPPPKSGNGI